MLNVPEGDDGSTVEMMVCVNITGVPNTISLSQKRVKLTILPSTTAKGILDNWLIINMHIENPLVLF